MWILFYELDALLIVKIFGAAELALYAIALALVSFLRNVFAQLYSPFGARFNHFIGLNDVDGLRELYRNVIVATMPIILFTTISLIILMKPLVYSWVGEDYAASIILAQFLVLSSTRAFVSYPGNFLVIAQQRLSTLYITSALLPIVLWTGVLLTISDLGLFAIPLFKFISGLVVFLIYTIITYRFLAIGFFDFIRDLVIPILLPCIVLGASLFLVRQYLPLEKGAVNVSIVAITGGAFSAIASLLYYSCSREFRRFTTPLICKVFST